MPTENFRSEEAYRKSRAYTHINGIPTHAEKVCIGKGKNKKCHKVKHSSKAVSSTGNRKASRRKAGTRKRLNLKR